MRCVLQRVKSASVTVDGEVISSIRRGILCLVGIGADDTKHEQEWLAQKLLALKVFPEDREGEVWGWKKSVVEADYEVLCVSQFTLQANLRKGAKPDFHGACPPEVARQMYEDLLADLRRRYKPERIRDGRFQAMMDVQLVNDGPVTLVLDSATDAPARPVPKAPLTEEQKQKAKEKLAARQKNREQRVSAATSGAGTPVTASASEADKAPAQATTEKSEKELIHEAEEKSRELAERFKVAMLEPVP
ncbi:enoyl-CoA hydratase/carnithine racemase [Rhodotorula diobovata]|uniref:D-aminoacyl-tRNA deacylase n=1 Tax=Rhodotorula diobovata TaxID=5288 RepID=A0A5C5FPG7_9BASI|nr:enoyl-CoA hydratase/carnithine racemase [Rhodotorula diobovata]TNY18146.1 enoyl-CoA hydratase/carnithine racemase [Rhodotorula diobovata]